MLKIIKASEPIVVEQIITVLYGQPGIGKSTLAFTSDNPLLLDFDKGSYRAENRKDTVSIDSWKDIIRITKNDLEPYNTVIVDTAGRALDFLTTVLLEENHKWNFNGALTLQGYGILKTRFKTWLNTIKTMGKDIVLIAHSSESKKGDDLLERLDVQGGSKDEIYKQADAMGRLYIEDKKRMLSFSPTDTAFGKNPANMDAIKIPGPTTNPNFLAEIMLAIKDKLNEMSETQKQRLDNIGKWKSKIDTAQSTDEFTVLAQKSQKADKDIVEIVKDMIHNAATVAGFIYVQGNGYMKKQEKLAEVA